MRPAPDRAPEASQAFAELDLANRKTVVIVAVSGGSDSLALLDLAAGAVAAARLLAVTVDHGLRPEAAGEAQWVAELCASKGIRHKTLKWRDGELQSGGVIARAREARYRLLAEAAKDAGTDLVLLGHTADDQAETVAMRGQRRATAKGWDRGGAGMARAVMFDGRVWFARPLLGMSRAELRAHLDARGIGWIDDPTNVDMRYERARIRAELAQRTSESEVAKLLRDANEAARVRTEVDGRAALLIEAYATMPSPGLFRLDPTFPTAKDREAAVHGFRGLLATVGGKDQLPDQARARDLLGNIGNLGLCATLSRTRVEAHRQGVFLTRENRDLKRLHAVEGLVWDGRYRLCGSCGDGGWTVAPMGTERARERTGFPGVPQRLMRAGLLAEPFFEPADDAPTDEKPPRQARFDRVVSPFARFLGEYDLALAGALARLIGAAVPPPSPFARHNED